MTGRLRNPLQAVLAAAVLLPLLWIVFGGNRTAENGPQEPALPAAAGVGEEVAPEPIAAPSPGSVAAHLPGADYRVELEWQGGSFDRSFVSPPTGRLEGRLTDHRGTPLPDATIRVLGGPHDGRQASVDEFGQFALASLLPGLHHFRIEAGGEVIVRAQRIRASGVTPRDFVLGGRAAFMAVVVDRAGRPLPGVRARPLGREEEAVSGTDGVLILHDLPAGRVLIDLDADRFAAQRVEATLNPEHEQPPERNRIQMEAGGAVRGQVLSWPGGEPPTVTLIPATDRALASVPWERWQRVPVDPDGRFEFVGVPYDYTVTVRVDHPLGVASPSQRQIRPSASRGGAVEFVVKASDQRVSGRVVDGAGRSVAATLVLEARDPQAVLRGAFAGLRGGIAGARLPLLAVVRREVESRNGRFSIEVGDAPAGGREGFRLTAYARGFAPSRRLLDRPEEGILLELEPARPLDLMLVREGGGPIASVALVLDGEETALPSPVIQGLAPGTYALRVFRGPELVREQSGMVVERSSQLFLP